MDDRNEEALPNQLLTIPDISSYIDMTQKSWCFKNFVDSSNQDSISSQHFDFHQYPKL